MNYKKTRNLQSYISTYIFIFLSFFTIKLYTEEYSKDISQQYLIQSALTAESAGQSNIISAINSAHSNLPNMNRQENSSPQEVSKEKIVPIQTCKLEKHNEKPLLKSGTIIFLSGISSTGKTATARKLQDILKEPYLYFDPDISPVPAKIFKEGSKEGITFEPIIINEEKIFTVRTGNYIKKLGMVAIDMYNLFAKNGFSLILNFTFATADPLLAEEFLKKYVKVLHNYKIYFVHLTASPEVAAKREKDRKGLIGLSAGQRYSMLKTLTPKSYDIEIDTSNLTSDQVAQKIVRFMDTHKNPKAFKRLYAKYYRNKAHSFSSTTNSKP